MPLRKLFATSIYAAPLKSGKPGAFNQQLADEIAGLMLADATGQDWSARNYPGGYTSYASHCKLHLISPLFAGLERAIRPHALRYAKALDYEMRGRRLVMTDCWANVMPLQVMHGSHLHPLSFISGTYYVQTPRGSAPIKFEDPRLGLLMAAPPRRKDAPAGAQPFYSHRAKAGQLVLFESWLRHEVPASGSMADDAERISVSFNYMWEDATKGA